LRFVNGYHDAGLSGSDDLLYVVSPDPELKHTLDCMATED
jgi:hypothetical protein